MNLNIVTCRGAMARLYEYIDRELSPADKKAVSAHLKFCRACSRRFRFEEQLIGRIREKCPVMRAPESLKRRIEADIEEL
jgi:mycothiol system anti-sigma-R factor